MKPASRALRVLAPLAGGALVGLSLPPIGSWPLAIVGVAVVSACLRERSLRGRAAVGFLAGVGQLAVGLAWAVKFTVLGYLVLVLLESAMFAVACALAPSGRGSGAGVGGAAHSRRVGPRRAGPSAACHRVGSRSGRSADLWPARHASAAPSSSWA